MGVPRLPGKYCGVPLCRSQMGVPRLPGTFCGQPFEGVSYKCIVYIRSRPTFRGPLFLEVRGA